MSSEVENVLPYEQIIFIDSKDGMVKSKDGKTGGLIIGLATDAQPVFQAAINACDGVGTLFIKGGTYQIGSTLDIHNKNVNIVGEKFAGRFGGQQTLGEVTLHRNFSGNLFNNVNTVFSHQRLENVHLDGNGTAFGGTSGTGIGIDAYWITEREWLRNVHIHNFDTGIQLDRVVYVNTFETVINQCNTNGLLMNGVSGKVNTLEWFGGSINFNPYNVRGYVVTNVGFHGTNLEAASINAVYLGSGSKSVNFNTCALEYSSVSGGFDVSGITFVKLEDGCSNIVFNGCNFHSSDDVTMIHVGTSCKRSVFTNNVFSLGGVHRVNVVSGTLGTVFIGNTRDANSPPAIATSFSGDYITCLGNIGMGSDFTSGDAAFNDTFAFGAAFGNSKLMLKSVSSTSLGVRNAADTSGANITVDSINAATFRDIAGTLMFSLGTPTVNFQSKSVVGIGPLTTTSGNIVFNQSGGQTALAGSTRFRSNIALESGASGISFSGMQMLPDLGTDTRYFVWVSGTTYRALRTADGVVEFSGTSAETVITNAIEAMSSGNTNKFSRGLGGVVKLGNGTYDMSISGIIIRWDNVTLEGAGNFATHLRVSGHRPAIELQGWSGNPDLRNIRIKDLYMTAEISGYSGSLLSLTGQSGTVAAGVRECEFNNLRFFDNDFRAGNAIGIDHTYGPMVYLTFENIKTDGFNNAFSFVATSGALASASQNWATSNTFRNCRLSQPYVGFNFNGISGSQFYASSFEDCYIQYNAAAQSGSPAPHSGTWTSWNMDDNGLHQNMNITNSIAWDGNATSGQSFAQVNIKSYLTLVGNQSDNVISGAGVVGAFAGGFISGGARILQFGRQTSTYGTADFVAASGQSTFVINHSMTKPPRFAAITPASSGMAASGVRWYTTVDSSNLNVVFASGFASGSNVTMMYRIDL